MQGCLDDANRFANTVYASTHGVHLIVGRCSAMAAYFVQPSSSDKVTEYDEEEEEESTKAALISSVK